MSLDDRSLREHLDRRATSGLTDPADLAETVIAGLPAAPRVSWWQPFVRGTRSLGLAAAAVVAVVVAIAVLPPRPPGPGTSPSPSDQSARSEYPADRALTLDELTWYLSLAPEQRADGAVIADVDIVPKPLECDDCPDHMIVAADRRITVLAGDEPVLEVGPYAFRVTRDGELELIASIQTASAALAWSLSDYLADLPDLLATDRLGPGAYVVAATAVRLSGPPACPSRVAAGSSTFDVGCGRAAWLAPDGTVLGSDAISAPDGSIRIQNDPDLAWLDGRPTMPGHFIVRPIGVDECFLCAPNSTSELLAVVTPIELPDPEATPGPTPPTPDIAPTATPSTSAAAISVTHIAFPVDGLTLDGFATADINVTVTFEGDVMVMGQMDGSTTPLICLEKSGTPDPESPHSRLLARTMLQTEGTNEWVASFRFTAGDEGTWRATCLVAYDSEGKELSLNPDLAGISPALEIQGVHAPIHTMEFNPTPAVIGQPLEVFGRVTDEDTGAPYVDVVVTIGIDNVCAEGGAGMTVRTNANGEYRYTIPVFDGSAVCTWMTDLPGIYPGANAQDPIAVFGMLFAHPTDL